jgi:hypothetical protein
LRVPLIAAVLLLLTVGASVTAVCAAPTPVGAPNVAVPLAAVWAPSTSVIVMVVGYVPCAEYVWVP